MLIPTLLASFVAAPSEVPPPRRFALGVEGELSAPRVGQLGPVSVGRPSIAVTVALPRHSGLQVLFGAGWVARRSDTPVAARSDTVETSASLRALFWPLRYQRWRLGLVAQAGYRGGFGAERAEAQVLRVRRHGFVGALGLRPEVFVAPRLSLHSQVGIAYTLASDNTTRTEQSIRPGGDVLGQAGVSIWF